MAVTIWSKAAELRCGPTTPARHIVDGGLGTDTCLLAERDDGPDILISIEND